MWSFVENCLKRYPDAKIISDTRILFYREMQENILLHGENLKSALKPRAKCAILCDSGLNAAMAILACWYADMIVIPLSKNYGQDHCNKIISLTDPDILIIDNDDCLYRLIKLNCRENSIKKMAISGECLSSGIAKNIRDVFPNAVIYSIYGLTEASPRVSYLPPADFDKHPESVGIPIDGVKIKIIDAQTCIDLPTNSRGIVMVSSPSLMKGYYNNQSLTQKTIVNGWLNTHDIGYKDENGYLYILGRADDMIIKAGMNIYPREIENEINKIPEISECLAYGKKGLLGEDIIIDIVLTNESRLIAKKDLMVKFKQVLPLYLMPSNINIVDTIPRNASGKLIRSKRFYNE